MSETNEPVTEHVPTEQETAAARQAEAEHDAVTDPAEDQDAASASKAREEPKLSELEEKAAIAADLRAKADKAAADLAAATAAAEETARAAADAEAELPPAPPQRATAEAVKAAFVADLIAVKAIAVDTRRTNLLPHLADAVVKLADAILKTIA